MMRARSGYACHECGASMDVIDTRRIASGVRRRRQCPECRLRATTYELEIPDEFAVLIMRRHGRLSIKRVAYLDPRPLYAEVE